MADPILTWAGGKRQLLDRIMRWIPPKGQFDTYFEPFFGGGAVFFSLEPSNGFINDVNERLMNFYQEFRDTPEQIIAENKKLDEKLIERSEEGQKEIYYSLRDEFNSLRKKSGECEDPFREAVLFLFFNRTCWNGLYRTNQKGEFNVPMGSKWTRMSSIEDRIRRSHRSLKGTEIYSEDFTYFDQFVGENDLVFLDPPYVEASETAQFKKYHPEGFTDQRQRELRDLAKEFDERGAYVVITNAAEAEEFYREDSAFKDAFEIKRVEGERRINSDQTKRQGIGDTDIIATNFTPFIQQRTFEDYLDLTDDST